MKCVYCLQTYDREDLMHSGELLIPNGMYLQPGYWCPNCLKSVTGGY